MIDPIPDSSVYPVILNIEQMYDIIHILSRLSLHEEKDDDTSIAH
jgi:hypothetical protein